VSGTAQAVRGASASSPGVDALAAEWCEALDAGHSSLDAAALYLKPAELAVHNRRLEDDRAGAVPLLGRLAREQHERGFLVRWLATPRHTRAMLGLPDTIDACVFDLEGVLTTSDRLQAAAWADTLDPLLLAHARPLAGFVPFDPLHDYADHLAGRSRLDGIRSFLAERGLTLDEGHAGDPPGIDTVMAISARKDEALHRRLEREGVAAYEASRSYLGAARTLGIRRAVVSGSVHAPTMIERAGLSGLVEACVDGNAIEEAGLRGKPAPDTLLEACRRLGVPPERTAAFETTRVGIQAAHAAGVFFLVGIGVAGADTAIRELGALFMAS
jgi:HAD superfamily hydrolase (TIGR01509 family)